MRKAATLIPRECLRAYAANADASRNLEAMMGTIAQFRSDRTILEREGSSAALAGVDDLLAGAVRRLCASPVSSRREADAKVATLELSRGLYAEGDHGLLMTAMIDAAIGIEEEAWPSPSRRH